MEGDVKKEINMKKKKRKERSEKGDVAVDILSSPLTHLQHHHRSQPASFHFIQGNQWKGAGDTQTHI